MILILFWGGFILLTISFEELDQFHYILFLVAMLYFTYLYNKVSPFEIATRKAILLLIIPNIIFWYISFVYNDFLSLTPISFELFLTILFIYTYIILYIFIETS